MTRKPSYFVETGGRYSPKSRAESFQSWFATAEILLVQPKETACSCRWKTIHTISQSWLGYGISTSRVLYGVVYNQSLARVKWQLLDTICRAAVKGLLQMNLVFFQSTRSLTLSTGSLIGCIEFHLFWQILSTAHAWGPDHLMVEGRKCRTVGLILSTFFYRNPSQPLVKTRLLVRWLLTHSYLRLHCILVPPNSSQSSAKG